MSPLSKAKVHNIVSPTVVTPRGGQGGPEPPPYNCWSCIICKTCFLEDHSLFFRYYIIPYIYYAGLWWNQLALIYAHQIIATLTIE